MFEASHSLIYTMDRKEADGGFLFSHNVSAEAVATYASYYQARDEWVKGHHARFGDAEGGFLGEMLVPMNELSRTEHYNDFLKPLGLHHLVTAVSKEGERRGAFVSFAMFRGPKHAEFSENHRALAAELVPHVQRSLLIKSRLSQVDHHRRIDFAMLDHSPVAAFLVDGAGKVARMSSAAERLVRSEHFLRLRNMQLQSVSRSLLSEKIYAVTLSPRGPHSAALMLRSQDGEHILHLLISRVSGLGRPMVYVVVGPTPGSANARIGQHLKEIYSLTPAEVRLCRALFEGLSVSEVSLSLGVALSTVNSQLKSIFSKMSVRRQSALIKILSELQVLSSAEAP